MKGDKALGSNEFLIALFQRCWSVVKEDTTKFFLYFHDNGSFERFLNATSIALILKKLGAVNAKNFNPISLVGSVHRTVAKDLSNILKHVMGKLLYNTQNAFIHGRQILVCSNCKWVL